MDSLVPITTHSYLIWQSAFSSVYINTLVFLITDQVPNNHPGHQISGSSGAMALLII